MPTARFLVVVLVLAQLIAYCVGEITGALCSKVLTPLWQEIFDNGGVRIRFGAIDLGALIATVISALVVLALGIFILGMTMRFFWPRMAKFLRIESSAYTKD
jgi:hypothetical protein